MSADEIYTVLRWINFSLAVLGVVLGSWRTWQIWPYFMVAPKLMMLSGILFCASLAEAMIESLSKGIEGGPRTALATLPLCWFVAAAMFIDPKDGLRKERGCS